MGAEDARKLFVGGLADSVTEEDLRALFESTGLGVIDVNVPRDRESGRPRGFGFVTLVSAEAAEGARARLDGSVQAGRAISVRRFAQDARRGPTEQRPQRADDRTVFLGKLPYDATPEEIGALFKQYDAGTVARVTLPVGPDGRPRGFGFVTLESAEAAATALERLSRAQLRGRQLVVTAAQPRGQGGGHRDGGSRDGGFGRDAGAGGYRGEGYGPGAPRAEGYGRDAGARDPGFSRGGPARPGPARPGPAARGRFEDEPDERSFGASYSPSHEDADDPDFADEEPASFGGEPDGASASEEEGSARPDSARQRAKEKKKAPRSAEKSVRRERGGGGSWHRWEPDED